MKQTVCDKCGVKLPGHSYNSHLIRLPEDGPQVKIIIDVEDICYYCAAELTFKAIEKWRTEYMGSVEGHKRNEQGKR
jgi:hypothetical protein